MKTILKLVWFERVLNKYPQDTMMYPHLAAELTNKQIIWAGLKHFYCNFGSGFTMARNIRFFHFLQKRYGWTDGWTDIVTESMLWHMTKEIHLP